jgi:hypothetical protein
MTEHSASTLYKLGSAEINFDEWKKRIDLLSASYGEAGKEFVDGKMIDIQALMPMKTLKKHEKVRDTPDSDVRIVEVDWTATDDAQLPTRLDKWETRCQRLEDNRGKMLTLLEASITPELSKELLLRHSAKVDVLIAKRDTLGFLALIKTQSLELATKSKDTLLSRWKAVKQEKGEMVTVFKLAGESATSSVRRCPICS